MATRGRKPTPTALKLLEGNPGKRKLNDREPKPEKKKPGRKPKTEAKGEPKKEAFLDGGKVIALKRAGWPISKIADEMGAEEAKILEYLQGVVD